jgi:hydrogenase maturation protease
VTLAFDAGAVTPVPMAAAARPLVVGYGNPLRSDDGIGWRVARALEADPRLGDATVVAAQQLLPELALDLSEASLAVLIDACVGLPPGRVVTQRVVPAGFGRPAWTHHLTPCALAGMALSLYGRAAPTFVVNVGIGTMEPGGRMTPAVEAAIPAIVDVVADLVRGRSDA